jgi:hypothetical protein
VTCSASCHSLCVVAGVCVCVCVVKEKKEEKRERQFHEFYGILATRSSFACFVLLQPNKNNTSIFSCSNHYLLVPRIMYSRNFFRSSLSLSLLPVVAVCSSNPGSILSPAARTRSTSTLSHCSANNCELSEVEKAKRLAGYKSIDNYVKSDMVVGLGTGSTAKYAVERLGAKLTSGVLTNIVAIPTSIATEKQARQLNIPLGKVLFLY